MLKNARIQSMNLLPVTTEYGAQPATHTYFKQCTWKC